MDKEIFLNLLKERILILDGGMGTMVQGFKLTEKDYRGKQFADWTSDLKGNNDLLCITRPDVIKSIHRQYLDAGADIFATNTFNANAISMEDYGMQGQVRNINLAAGKLAREVADGFMKEHPDRTIFVAGSVGPTNKTASMSPDVSDPAYRAVTYLDLYSAYKEQVDALVDGGVDIVLFETTFDTLNVKAGLEAAEAVLKEKGKDLPIMLSLTLSAQGGRTFSGQTLLAFLASVQHTNIVSVGLNCSFGAADMKPFLAELAKHAPYYISAYPNAGPIEWDSEMHGMERIYEAEFRINGFQFDVKIAPDGKIVRIKEEIAASSLPEAVRASVLKRYPGCRIKEAEKITEGELVRYKVEVADSRDDYDVLIAPDGNILHVDR